MFCFNNGTFLFPGVEELQFDDRCWETFRRTAEVLAWQYNYPDTGTNFPGSINNIYWGTLSLQYYEQYLLKNKNRMIKNSMSDDCLYDTELVLITLRKVAGSIDTLLLRRG